MMQSSRRDGIPDRLDAPRASRRMLYLPTPLATIRALVSYAPGIVRSDYAGMASVGGLAGRKPATHASVSGAAGRPLGVSPNLSTS